MTFSTIGDESVRANMFQQRQLDNKNLSVTFSAISIVERFYVRVILMVLLSDGYVHISDVLLLMTTLGLAIIHTL